MLSRRPFGFGAAIVAIVAIACAGDETAGTGGPDAAASPERDPSPARGSATLEIDGETYAFDRVLCAFGAEETGREETEFSLSARQDGLQLDAAIDTRYGHVVSLDDIRNPQDPRVGWEAGVSGDPIIRVDGRRVSARAVFVDAHAGASAPGTLTARCP